jgi:hypothetical protein
VMTYRAEAAIRAVDAVERLYKLPGFENSCINS